MPIENIPSIMEFGILSNERAKVLKHRSVAMQEVQDRRDRKKVPGGLRLHQYANLYFHARNPMLYKRKADAASLCVLQISTDVRHEQGVVFTDCNAASDYVRFLHPSQARLLNFDAIFALDWRHTDDEIAQIRHRSQKCAEVLVPHCVEPRFVAGAYVVDAVASNRLRTVGFKLPIMIDAEMFFR
jgi:ssDNA thymidine ADP-ribosyltransferase DarT-like protein